MLSSSVPSSVRDQVRFFINNRCKSHNLDVQALPHALSDLLAVEPSRTACFVAAMRSSTSSTTSGGFGRSQSQERDILIANFLCYVLQNFPPPSPQCLSEVASFADRHSRVGSAAEFRRLANVVSMHSAVSSSESRLPPLGGSDHHSSYHHHNSDVAADTNSNALQQGNNTMFSNNMMMTQSADSSQQQSPSSTLHHHHHHLHQFSGASSSLTPQQAAAAAAGGSSMTTMMCDTTGTNNKAGGNISQQQLLQQRVLFGGSLLAGGATILTPANPMTVVSSLDLAGRRRVLTVAPLSTSDELVATARQRNAEFAGAWKYVLRPRILKSYVEQQRLRLGQSQLSDEVATLLSSFDSKHNTANITSAIVSMVKFTLDAYTAKLPFAIRSSSSASNNNNNSNNSFLREASESLLHVLSTLLLRADHFVVKSRAFEILLNMAVHVQFLDFSATSGSASIRLISAEIEWLLTQLLEQLSLVTSSRVLQLHLDAHSVRLLVAALKTTLLIVPSSKFASCVPLQTMALFLRLPVTRLSTTQVYDSICDAACERILFFSSQTTSSSASSTRGGDNNSGRSAAAVEGGLAQLFMSSSSSSSSSSAADNTNNNANSLNTHKTCTFSAEAFENFGGFQGIVDHLISAPTSFSASCLFAILYCAHNASSSPPATMPDGAAADATTTSSSSTSASGGSAACCCCVIDIRPLRVALRVGLHWHCRFLLCNGEGFRSLAQIKQLLSQDGIAISTLLSSSFFSAAASSPTPSRPSPQQQQQQHETSSASSSSIAASASRISASLTSFVTDLISGAAAARTNMCTPEMASVNAARLCHELSDPRNLASLLDDADAVVADFAARMCSQALFHEWSTATTTGGGGSGGGHTNNNNNNNNNTNIMSPQQQQQQQQQQTPSPTPSSSNSVTGAVYCVLRLPSTRIRSALIQVIRSVTVILRTRGSGNIMRKFSVFIQQCLDLSSGAAGGGVKSTSLPFVCGLVRVTLECCMQQSDRQFVDLSSMPFFFTTGSSSFKNSNNNDYAPVVENNNNNEIGTHNSSGGGDVAALVFGGDIVSLFENRIFSVTPSMLDSIGGPLTLWKMYRGLRHADDQSVTLLNQTACRLRLAVLRVLVSLLERSTFDASDSANWSFALNDPCSQCCAVVAHYVVRAVSEPFELEAAAAAASKNPYAIAKELLDSRAS